ncbi:MAG: dihydroorotase [Acidobacteria bacterium 13_1_40CM_2_68_5]|nr:MAG: dihydroorotase [Acidobacteria bacterium 13_1_40CM_2_68_5]
MASLLIKGGRVIDPATGTDALLDLLVVDGHIAERRPARQGKGAAGEKGAVPAGTKVLEAAGHWVCPGFVDMHVHLREPGQEHKESVETGTRAAAAGGFTSIACMPNTEPWNDGLSVTEYIVAEARRKGAVNVFPIGCVSKGGRGEELAEIGDMARSGAVAVSDDGQPVANTYLLRMAMEYTKIFGIPLIDHCEDRDLSAGGAMHEGYVSTMLGLQGIPAAAEEVAVAADLAVAGLTQGRLHVAHLSTRGGLEKVRQAKREGLRVTCEVTPHHLVLTDQAVADSDFDPNTKMNPPLRGEQDRQALIEGLRDGTIDAVASDHAPHQTDEKLQEFDEAPFGIIGLETSVPLIMDRFVRQGVITPARFVELMSVNPARILGLRKGTLAAGADADVTIIDPELERKVDVAQFRSKSRNSPFHGWALRGWPVATVVAGRLVHELRAAATR